MESISACRTCGLVQRTGPWQPAMTVECCRCGSVIGARSSGSLAPTAAFSLAALICYVPANVYPILRMNLHGAYSENTIWGGCVSLFHAGQWLVAAIVFMASIVIPLFKLLGLLFLAGTAYGASARWRRQRTRIYRWIEVVGPWAMLDVFLLSVLVGLVKLQQLATVLPGPGLLAFAAVVVLTILATAAFDPRLIWQQPEDER